MTDIIYRITFHEWQKFQIVLPANSKADAIRIAECLRMLHGTACFEELDGGTDDFDARAREGGTLTREDIARLEALLPDLEDDAVFQADCCGDTGARAFIKRFRQTLTKMKGNAP